MKWPFPQQKPHAKSSCPRIFLKEETSLFDLQIFFEHRAIPTLVQDSVKMQNVETLAIWLILDFMGRLHQNQVEYTKQNPS